MTATVESAQTAVETGADTDSGSDSGAGGSSKSSHSDSGEAESDDRGQEGRAIGDREPVGESNILSMVELEMPAAPAVDPVAPGDVDPMAPSDGT